MTHGPLLTREHGCDQQISMPPPRTIWLGITGVSMWPLDVGSVLFIIYFSGKKQFSCLLSLAR